MKKQQEDTTQGNPTIPKTYKEIHPYLIEIGKEIIPEFEINIVNEYIYNLFYSYFCTKDTNKLDRNKGILLMGNIGTGKSILFKLFCKLIPSLYHVSTRFVVRDFMIKGVEVVDKYGRENRGPLLSFGRNKPVSYCFDDLGLENSSSQLYGNKANVIADILLDRYELRLMTHATTNLDVDQLEVIYGDRLRNRFKEMFNVVRMTGKSLR